MRDLTQFRPEELEGYRAFTPGVDVESVEVPHERGSLAYDRFVHGLGCAWCDANGWGDE